MHDCGKSNLEKQQEKVRQQVALLNKLANYYIWYWKKNVFRAFITNNKCLQYELMIKTITWAPKQRLSKI